MAEFTFNKEIAEERRRKKTFTFDDRAIKESQERRQQAALKEYNKQNLITDNEAMDFFLSDKRDTIKAAGAEKAWQDMESYFAWQKEQDRLLNMDIDAQTDILNRYTGALDEIQQIQQRKNEFESEKSRIEGTLANEVANDYETSKDRNRLSEIQNELEKLFEQYDAIGTKYQLPQEYTSQKLEELEDSLKTDADKLRGDIAYAKFKQGGAKLEKDALSASDFDSKNAYGRDNFFGAESVEFFIDMFRDLNMNYAWEENEFFAAMTEKERKILGYYLAHGDSDAATEYVNYLRETVGNKVAEQHRKDADTWYEKLGYSALAAIDQFRQEAQGLGDAFTGDTSYTPASPLQQGSALIRQDIKDGEGFGNKVLGFGYDLINTTAHMLPSIAVGLANPTAGAILMGTTAGGGAYTEMINEGYTWGSAVAYGTLVGISETKLEKVLGATLGTSKLAAKLLPKVNKAAKRVAITIGADMISEFTEESLQAVLEPWFKSIVTGLDYDAPDIEEVLYNGLLGAISGGMFSGSRVGGNTIADAALNRANDIQAGNALLKSENANGDIQSLVDAAQQSDNKKLKKAAEKVSKTFNDGQYDASARNVGRLARLSKEQLVKSKYDAASGANIKSQTIAKLTESGLQTKEAGRAFDTIVRDATKGEISQELQKLMQKNSAVRPVYDQMTEYMTEEAATKRAAEVEASSPVTEISNRIVDQRLKDAGIDVVEDAFVADDPVAVESIDEKGNLIIKTKNGNTVTYEPSEGMSNVSSKAGRKVANASLYGINGANAYIKLAPDGINTEFLDTFNEIYDQGITGKEFSPTNSSVSVEVQQSIYNAGKADLENAAAKSRKAVEEAKQKEAAFVKKQMGFKSDRVTISDAAVEKIKSASEKGLSEQYKSSVAVIDGIAKMLQVNINIVASKTDASGRYISENGSYNRATNTFTFDITAGMDNVEDISYTAMVKTAGHELTHFIQKWSPSKYLTLKNTTLKFLESENSKAWINERLRDITNANKAIGKTLTLEGARDELVADAFGDVLTQVDFAEAILRADKTLFDKVHSWVRSHVKKFKKSLDIAVKNVESQTLAADTMREAGKRAQKLYDLWADSLTTALENSTSFNMDQAIEQNKDLVAFHNITAEQLRDAVERDNLLMPSIAISNRAISEFGEISIVFDKSTIDPKLADNKLFGADAWTPTRSKLKKNAKFDRSATEAFVKRAQDAIGSRFEYTAQQLEDAIFNADGSIYNAFASDPDMQAIYAAENGIAESKIEATLDSDNGWRQYKKWLNGISDELITSYDSASNEEIISDMKSQPATAKPFKLSENGELVVPVAEYSSIEDLRKNKNRLSENADEQLKTVGEELLSWAKDISLNSEATLRKTVSVINNTFDSRYSVPDIVRSFKSNGIDISQQTASELQSLYKKAVELPTRYFEAKPQRAVSLSEIKAIIMPENGNMSDLESYFNDMGIEIVKYTTEQSRIDALNSLDNVKFQSRRVTKEQDAALENSTSGQTDVDSDVQLQARYAKADQNLEILNLIHEVENNRAKSNKKVYLGTISESNAKKINDLTGIDVSGFQIAIEARQIEHILKDHGKNGKSDRSLSDPADIAKMQYVLNSPDDIKNSGRTQAYSEYVNGRNRTAKTVKYEKNLGDRNYYVVQAVANTEAKTLYIVTAYISKNDIKKGASQLINAKSPNATSENGSVVAHMNMISQESSSVKSENKQYSARSVGMDFDTVTRREVADALDSFAEKLPDVRKAKLKGALISYRSHLENYERSRNTYEYALRNGNEELQNNALLSMKLNETVIRETENETIFRMNWGELESSLEGFVEKKREQYKRGRDEYMSRARATLAELRKNISSAERKAREMAQKRQTAEFRMRQIELRTQRDRYTSLLNKEKTKIKKAIESPSETASIPKGAEPIAKKLINVIDSMQKVIGTRGYTRSSQELLKMMLDVANVNESDDNAKYVLQRTYSQDKILLGTKLAMDQFISDLSLLSQDFKKLDPEYAPKEGEPYRVPSAASALIYDPDIDSSLSDFIAEYQGFYPGSPFAMENIYDCIKIVRAIGHQITSANKAYIGGKMVDVLKLRDDLHRDMLVSSEFVAKLLGSNAINQFLTPKTMMHVFFGATESADTFYNLYDEGQTRYIRFVNGARDIFKPLEKAIEGNKFNRDKLTLKTDLKYVDGTPVVFNEDLALSFIKICENEDSLRHAVWGGLRVPDIHPYNKGKIKQAYGGNRLIENISTEINKAQKVFGTEPTDEYIESVLEDAAKEGKEISDKQYFDLYSKSIEFERQMYREAELMELYKKTAEKLKKQLSKEGIEMLGLLRKYYDGYAREKLDEATMEMYGFTKTLIGSKSYFPIRVSDNQKNNADNDLVKRDYSLENWGSMKNRKKSKAGIDLFGAVTELSSFIENTARYYAWTRTLKTSRSILKTQIIRDNGTVTTLAGAAAEKYGSYDSSAKGIKKLKNLFTADLDKYMKELDAEINGATENKTPEFIARMHGAFVTSALVANISPGFKQASALPLVSVDAGYKSFLKAYSKSLAPFANGKVKAPLMLTKAQMNYIARYSEVYRFRSSGMLDIDFAAMKNNKSAIAKFLTSKGMSWAELADAQVLGHQFYAILDNVKKINPGLSAQDAAIKAGKQLDKTIQEFQANYTVLQRAPLLRSGNVLKLIVGTFRSQQITLLNAQVDSLVRTHSLSEQAKRAEGAEKKRLQRERAESRKRSGKIAVATAFSNALNGLLGALVALIRRKEKDGEEIAEDAFFDFLDSYFTMIPGFGDAASFLVDRFTDRAFFGDGFVSIGFLDTLNDSVTSAAKIAGMLFDDEDQELSQYIKELTNVLAVFGIPARNAYNIIKMLIEWVEGVSNLFGVDWEVDTEEW